MLSDSHRKAEALSVEAASASSEGRLGQSLDLYAEAARLEEAALEETPFEKIRTRSILSVSVASLLYKAQMYDEAELVVFRFLGSKKLVPWAEKQLRELLPVVMDERLLATTLDRRYSGESIVVALRGGEIGSGTGPLDLVLEKAAGFQKLLFRFAEWCGKYPLRLRGNPPKEIIELIQARATEPASGSYRLEIRLTEPFQLEMFDKGRVRPRVVSDSMFQFLGELTKGDYGKLEEQIPETDYRKALLQLTKSVTPGGKRLKEIGIYRSRKDAIQSVYLTDALPPIIKEVLPKRPKDIHRKEGELRGTIRALHLDKNWLEILLPEGKGVKCDTVHDMLDDLVGPMVNREVIVRGPKRIRSGAERIVVEEIELADEG